MSSRNQIKDAEETIDIGEEISRILETGLDRKALAICIRMIDCGVSPEALSLIVRELQTTKEKKGTPKSTGSD